MAPDADTFADTSAPADSQREHRLRKADEARGAGYPYRYSTDASAAGIRAAHTGLAPDQVTEHEVRIAGPIGPWWRRLFFHHCRLSTTAPTRRARSP